MPNTMEQLLQHALSRHGWTLSPKGIRPMWTHSSLPGRRFDTACAVSELLKQKATIKLG